MKTKFEITLQRLESITSSGTNTLLGIKIPLDGYLKKEELLAYKISIDDLNICLRYILRKRNFFVGGLSCHFINESNFSFTQLRNITLKEINHCQVSKWAIKKLLKVNNREELISELFRIVSKNYYIPYIWSCGNHEFYKKTILDKKQFLSALDERIYNYHAHYNVNCSLVLGSLETFFDIFKSVRIFNKMLKDYGAVIEIDEDKLLWEIAKLLEGRFANLPDNSGVIRKYTAKEFRSQIINSDREYKIEMLMKAIDMC